MSKKKKGPGGNLNRSEIVQTRLSPKLRWAAEILARQDRRTVSSLIEGLVEKAASEEIVNIINSKKDLQNNIFFELPSKRSNPISVKDAVQYMWSESEAERFVAFAIFFPELLTPEEEKMWQFIALNLYFWECFEIRTEQQGKKVASQIWPIVNYQSLKRDNLNTYWDTIHGVYMRDEPPIRIQEVPGNFDHVGDIKPVNHPILMKKGMPNS